LFGIRQAQPGHGLLSLFSGNYQPSIRFFAAEILGFG
jgi:hypothetical protein